MTRILLVGLLVLLGTCSGAIAGPEEPAQAASRAEVQMNLCSEPQQVIQALQLKRRGQAREAWYFDTANLDLFKKGVLFRLRITGPDAELTLKAAHQDCAKINPALIPADQAKCEYDMHGDQLVGAVSINSKIDGSQVRDLFKEKIALADLLSPAQIRYLQEGGSATWPLPPELKRLGPGKIATYRKKGQAFSVEVWQLPSGLRTVEISQKSTVADARHVRANLNEILTRNKIKICSDQGSQAGRKLNEYLKGL